jgi:hypothetical protein
VWLRRGVWQCAGGAEHCLYCETVAAACSGRGDEQKRRVVARPGVVEGLGEPCWSVEGAH